MIIKFGWIICWVKLKKVRKMVFFLLGVCQYISKIYDTLNDAINYQDFAPTINQLKEIFEGLSKDIKFNKTALVSVASVSYYSSLFWSEINIVEPNG